MPPPPPHIKKFSFSFLYFCTLLCTFFVLLHFLSFFPIFIRVVDADLGVVLGSGFQNTVGSGASLIINSCSIFFIFSASQYSISTIVTLIRILGVFECRIQIKFFLTRNIGCVFLGCLGFIHTLSHIYLFIQVQK